MKRFISGVLALLMTLSAFVGLYTVPVLAADEQQEPLDYVTTAFLTAEEKLASMEKRASRSGYSLYVDGYTGEVAYVNDVTGQAMFTNPYDVATTYGSSSTKEALLSQIIIKYIDLKDNIEKTFRSYTEAALRGQIEAKNIKNGVRVEYTLGREDTNYLVPRLITVERFENEILANMPTDYIRNRVKNFYILKDPAPYQEKEAETGKTPRQLKEMYEDYPITKEFAIYVMPEDVTTKEIKTVEDYIKTYCPEYSYDELAFDHEQTQYVEQKTAEALFKLSLEYTIDENGDLVVNLPANGIRFDSVNYSLSDIQVLPYMGAGDTTMDGYCFIPDGSGALVEFEDVRNTGVTIANSVYGIDYAYHTITGSAQRQILRLPVFGLVENYVGEKYLGMADVTEPTASADEASEEGAEAETVAVRVTEPYSEDRGFFAIIEEGDSLANIALNVGGALHKYATVYTSFNPRPKDTYDVGGAGATWTVTSDRKYVGNLKIRYIMLDDQGLAEANGLENSYDTTWLGMAAAYRDYLESNGIISRLEDGEADIPLYIETLGALDKTEKILSMPVVVSKSMTSFEDVKTITNELLENDITNINYRLSGYANGGLIATVPYNLKWERSVGGAKGFTALQEFASAAGIGLYPDFDFAYVHATDWFDGVSASRHAVKTIDDRYANKQIYSESLQDWITGQSRILCISPSVYDRFFGKLSGEYAKFSPTGISLSTLGTDLNSDFDDDDPHNREDSKQYTTEVFVSAKEQFGSVMTDGGNAYALAYTDHLLNVALDSSDYRNASATVPFVGAVLHGYIEFAGEPINMAGDIDYEILRAIENGASPYFVIAYSNTELIKEKYSDYYSVRYDIWKDSIISIYGELNALLSGVRTSRISEHEFLVGQRVPDADEILADQAEAEALAQAALEEAIRQAEKDALAQQRELYESGSVAAGQTVNAKLPEETEQPETAQGTNKYTADNNKIVRVSYENGATFLLNYNHFDVTVEYGGNTYTVAEYGYQVINEGGAN